MSHQAARGPGWGMVLVLAGTALAVGFAAATLTRTDPITPTADTVPTTTLPAACADAAALADKLIGPGSRLAKAARAHAAVMELLEDGDITGHQAYVRGQAQVASMLHDSPDVAVFVDRYREVRAKCPQLK